MPSPAPLGGARSSRLLTDPVTAVGCSPLAETPDLATLPELIRLKYLTSVNRWTGLPASGRASLQQATAGRPDRSLLWREHLAGLDRPVACRARPPLSRAAEVGRWAARAPVTRA